MKKSVESGFPRDNERGVALLFALGILSLLLFIGLAFVADSVVALKIAANNSNRSGADLLARSALNNAAIAVMEYQLELKTIADSSYNASTHLPVDGRGGALPTDFSTVVSFYSPTAAGDGVDSTKSAAEELPVASIYRNPANTSYETAYEGRETADSRRAPGWVYVSNGESGDDLRVIGRYAYRVLPPASSTRINLGYMLGVTSTGLPVGAGLGSNSGTIYDFAAFYDMNGVTLNSEPFPIAMLSDDGNSYTTLRGSYDKSEFIGSFDHLFNAMRSGEGLIFNTDGKRNWMRRWFDDSLMPADIEAFRVTDSNGKNFYYHRFPLTYSIGSDGSIPANLSELKTKWDSVFGNAANIVIPPSKSSADPEAALKALLANPVSFTAATLEKLGATDLFSYKPNEFGGLPFFLLIGDDSGSFSNLDTRRKQIAANFLDYCDSDDVPTSDKAPATWSVTDSAMFPDYTGNERTPYINEIAVGVNPQIAFGVGTDEFASQPVALKFSAMVPMVFVELVKIYEDVGDIGDYSVRGKINKLEVKADVNTGIRVKYEYEKNDGSGNITWEPVEFDYDVNAKPLGTLALSEAGDISTFTIPFAGSSLEAGYWIAADIQGNSTFMDKDKPVENSIRIDFSPELKSKITTDIAGFSGATGNFRVTSAYVREGIQYSSLDVKLELAPLMLFKKSGLDNIGMDFVRIDKLGELAFNTASSPHYPGGFSTPATLSETEALINTTVNLPFYIGGFEVRDPRQNLNPSLSADATKTDWRIDPAIVFLDNTTAADGTSSKIISMHFIDSDYTKAALLGATPAKRLEDRITRGLINKRRDGIPAVDDHIADPSHPAKELGAGNFYAAEDVDTETATDPAWLGNAEGQHLSTAYIRNAPMQSFWELGAIHRGAPWQTINLRGADLIGSESSWAGAFHKMLTAPYTSFAVSGTSYSGGDGAILDMVKLGEAAVSYGMIDINMLRGNYPGKDVAGANDELLLKRILQATYRSAPLLDAGILDLYSVKNAATTELLDSDKINAVTDAINTNTADIATRSEFIEIVRSAMTTGGVVVLPGANKREQDELFGKIMPLLKAEPALVTTFAVDVIAQTIRDIGGVSVKRTKSDGTAATDSPKACTFGIFDVDSTDTGIYYDEITGEAKFRAIYECNPFTGKIKLREIIPLEN